MFDVHSKECRYLKIKVWKINYRILLFIMFLVGTSRIQMERQVLDFQRQFMVECQMTC